MENLVIKLEVDLRNSNQVADAIKLLTPFNAGSIEVKDAEVLTPEKPKKKKAAEPTKAEAAEPTKAEASEQEYKIEDVRQEVAKKAINNREEVKSKLTELGANNVSSLDPNAYGDFMVFLKGLK